MRAYTLTALILITLDLTAQKGLTRGCKDKVENYDSGEIWRAYKLCDGVMADTFIIYFKDGEIDKLLDYGPPGSDNPVYFIDYKLKGNCRKITGFNAMDQNNKATKVGVWRYYWKDDVRMDSVVYDNGAEIYRAHYSNKGVLESVKDTEGTTFYKKDGSVKSVEKK